MTPTRYAFVKANWHAEIVSRALDGFCELIPVEQVDVFDVPGAFELPLLCRDLAATERYAAVAAAAFVVDCGVYRHEFVAQAVADGLMLAGMDTGVPILSVSLTPISIKRPNITSRFTVPTLSKRDVKLHGQQ